VISREEAAELALLARIAFSDEELDAVRGDLAAILDHFATLAQVNTDGVEPMTHAVPMTLRLRPDTVGESLPQEVALAGAPAVAGDHFAVPAIITSTGGDK
jgi:aspartyl-tRNA(Asn)/glutamyl-tRNA(Gln) amidotransferase subunit C